MSKPENIVTSNKVDIAAPAAVVWEVLTDLARYREWNPFTVQIESTLKLGEPVDLHIPVPGQRGQEMVVREFLVAFEPDRLLSWEQRPSGESKDAARRDQYIEMLDAEHSRYFTTDIFLGVNADDIMGKFGPWVKASFDAVAEGVKAQAEKLHREGDRPPGYAGSSRHWFADSSLAAHSSQEPMPIRGSPAMSGVSRWSWQSGAQVGSRRVLPDVELIGRSSSVSPSTSCRASRASRRASSHRACRISTEPGALRSGSRMRDGHGGPLLALPTIRSSVAANHDSELSAPDG
jgi:hypothetical protein